MLGEDAHEGVGSRIARRLIQGGDREWVPEPFLERRPLAVAIQLLLHRQPGRLDGHRL